MIGSRRYLYCLYNLFFIYLVFIFFWGKCKDLTIIITFSQECHFITLYVHISHLTHKDYVISFYSLGHQGKITFTWGRIVPMFLWTLTCVSFHLEYMHSFFCIEMSNTDNSVTNGTIGVKAWMLFVPAARTIPFHLSYSTSWCATWRAEIWSCYAVASLVQCLQMLQQYLVMLTWFASRSFCLSDSSVSSWTTPFAGDVAWKYTSVFFITFFKKC